MRLMFARARFCPALLVLLLCLLMASPTTLSAQRAQEEFVMYEGGLRFTLPEGFAPVELDMSEDDFESDLLTRFEELSFTDEDSLVYVQVRLLTLGALNIDEEMYNSKEFLDGFMKGQAGQMESDGFEIQSQEVITINGDNWPTIEATTRMAVDGVEMEMKVYSLVSLGGRARCCSCWPSNTRT